MHAGVEPLTVDCTSSNGARHLLAEFEDNRPQPDLRLP